MNENKVYKVTVVRHQEQTYYTIAKNEEEAKDASWALEPDGWDPSRHYQSFKDVSIDEDFGKDDEYDESCWLIANYQIYRYYDEFIDQLKTQCEQ
jgi:hypothetical protein